MVQTRSMQRKSGGALCGDFVPQRRRSQKITVREVNSETILRDAIDGICKFLDMRDLHAVSQVCRFWNAAAAREVTKRRQIQRLLIPHNLEDIANSNSIYHIPAALSVKPYVALLFVGSKLIEEFNFGRSNSLLLQNRQTSAARTIILPMDNHSENCCLSSVFDVYKRQLPHNLIGMEICEYLTDNDIFMPKELKKQIALEAAGSQSILGLFLPMEKGMDVRVAWCEGLNDEITNVADYLIDQLTIDDLPQNHGSTTLVFAQSIAGYFLAQQVISNMRQRYPDRNEHTWGGMVGKELGATNCNEIDSSSDGKKIVVGLRIASPGLQTWMTVIDCVARRNEIMQRLQEFKQQVHPKKHTIGLAYGPKFIQPRIRSNLDSFHDGQDVMRAVKDVFTDIQFTGLFNRDCRILVSCNAIDEELSQKMNRDKFMALIVIAYD